jgi:predicted metal-binding protein
MKRSTLFLKISKDLKPKDGDEGIYRKSCIMLETLICPLLSTVRQAAVMV